jgi:hypothetical protein
MDILSKHPFDWIIHFILCFCAVYFHQATILATIFVAVMLEYEQWSYSKQLFTWEYFYFKVFGDLVADGLGIVVAKLLHSYFNWGI